MATKIAFINFKGGVGKTTSTVNLCKALHDMGKKCLAIDADPQGNASTMLGYRYTEEKEKPESERIPTLYNVMTGKSKLEDSICMENENPESFDFIAANTELYQCEQELVSRTGRENILKMLLSEVEQDYDFIIIDCPPNYGLLSINAMCACDYLIIPINCEVFSIDGLGIISAKCEEIKKLINPKLDILGYVMFRYDVRLKLHRDAVESMGETFPDKVFHSKVRTNTKAAESPAAKTNIFDFAPTSSAAKDYKDLAAEIFDRIEKLKLIGG